MLPAADAPILFFDSGLGGLTVLGPTRALLPTALAGLGSLAVLGWSGEPLQLFGVLAQLLCKRSDKPGRTAVHEIMFATPAVAAIIREGATQKLYDVITAALPLFHVGGTIFSAFFSNSTCRCVRKAPTRSAVLRW